MRSSIRYKDNVKDMDDTSDRLMKLRPVTFTFKSDENKKVNYGLIAEEVQKIFPELAVIQGGEPLSVKYHELPVLLLNELKKLEKRVKELESKSCTRCSTVD